MHDNHPQHLFGLFQKINRLFQQRRLWFSLTGFLVSLLAADVIHQVWTAYAAQGNSTLPGGPARQQSVDRSQQLPARFSDLSTGQLITVSDSFAQQTNLAPQETIFAQLLNPVGIVTDSSANIYALSGDAITRLIKYAPNGTVLGQANLADFPGHLTQDPNTGRIVHLRNSGQIEIINPATGVSEGLIFSGASLGQLYVGQLTPPFDVNLGIFQNYPISPNGANYGDIAVLQRGNQIDLFVTAISNALAFVMRARVTAPSIASLLTTSPTVNLQIVATSGVPPERNLTPGIAVNTQEIVMTTLPVCAQIPPCLGSFYALVAFDADFPPNGAPVLINGRNFCGSRGMTTDSADNFYIATGSSGSSLCTGQHGVIQIDSLITTASCLPLSYADERDVAINPAGSTGYVTTNAIIGANGAILSFPIAPPPCNYSIQPTSESFPASGGTDSVSVTTAGHCNWSVTGVPTWITINSGNGGTGSGTVGYTVAPNTGSSTRMATLTIAGQPFTVTQAGTCAVTPINIGQTVNGALANTDCQSPLRNNGAFADRYSFTGASGQQVAISLDSTAIDPYLYLIGPGGTVIAEDDDGGPETNARIPAVSGFFSLPANGTYVIEATSFDPADTGSYTLNLAALSCPTITGINPASGPVGTTVVINGTNFNGVSGIKFANNLTATFSINGGGTQITTTVPNGAVSGPITVSKTGCPDVQSTSFTVVACSASLNPTNQNFAAGGGAGSVSVNIAAGCSWTATSNAGWLTITSGSSGSGNGTVNYTVAANNGPGRSGTLTIAGQTFTVTQNSGCAFSINPTTQNHPASGNTGSVSVTTAAGCSWTAVSNVPWTSITAGSSGAGNGTVNYAVTANTGPQRSGTLTVAGQAFTVTQNSGCTFIINPTNQSFAANGGSGTVAVTASDTACGWTATINAAWITVTSGASGSGNGTVNYTVATNPGPQRSGTVSIAGQTFTVNQTSGCGFTINPTSQNFAASGGTGNVAVTASDAACAWTATSNAVWITITSGASGSGNGSVGFTVTANTGPQRSGTMTIAGQTFTVTQDNGCTFSINPSSQNFAAAGGSNSVGVTAGNGCNWTATSNAA